MSIVGNVEPMLPAAPREPAEIDRQDLALALPSFTAQTAWRLGTQLRTRLLGFARPAVVDISLAQGEHCVFRATTHAGTTPDHDRWVARKRNAVLRFGRSTWSLHHQFHGDEAAFAAKFALRGPAAADYAIHGGGWPLRVQGVDGLVAVVVVSGLKQEQDHAVIVQAVAELLEEMGLEMGEKKKED